MQGPLRRLRLYAQFVGKCISMLAGERLAFTLFIILAFAAAITESFSVSMLVPILEGQGNGNTFSTIPILGRVSQYFRNSDGSVNLRLVSLSLLIVLLLRGVATYSVQVLAGTIPLRIQRRISQQCYDAIIKVQLSHIHNKKSGELFNHLIMLPIAAARVLANFGEFIWNCLVIVVYLFFMVTISFWATLGSLVFLAFLSLLLRRINSGPLRRVGQQLADNNALLNHVAMETLTGLRPIRVMAAEAMMCDRFQQANNAFTTSQRRLLQLNMLSGSVMNTGSGAFICLLLFLASFADREIIGDLLGQLLLFIILMFRLIGPVAGLNIARARMVGDMHAFETSETFIHNCQSDHEPNGTLPFTDIGSGIVFENVEFGYGGTEGPVLRGIDLIIPKGAMVALVGRSGAGKSTVVSLLARFYDPTAGRILINGIDLKEYELASWRSRMSLVAQDNVIFNDTVANNIRFGRDIPLEHVRQAARLSSADEFIENLPDRYDTYLGDRGLRLSGGQQQRIAIARAIVNDPAFLILDEATSSLDSLTEAAIQGAVENMRGGRTMLVIAHRLSTLHRADRIYVLSDGKVVESGTHQELAAANGLYRELLQQQSFSSHSQ